MHRPRPTAVVKKGTIVELGSHQSLMEANGAYATLVSLQQAEGSAAGDDSEDQYPDSAKVGPADSSACAHAVCPSSHTR